MDRTTERLATYAASLRYEDVSQDALAAAKRLLIDTLGCALGAIGSEPARVAERLAARASSIPGARVFGSGRATSLEAATFANTVMVRYLDYNDMYISLEAGHASDMIPALIAVAEGNRQGGRELAAAIAVACEVFTGLADVVSLWNKGWDHGLLVALGTAAGVGSLLRLPPATIAEALSLAVVPNVPLRQTRSGELSMWKGCATAASARAGLFAALLAAEGMTGPTRPFEGRHGLWQQVTGAFDVGGFGSRERPYGVERITLKYFPTEGHSHVPLWLLLRLRDKARLDDIESVNVTTYQFAYREIGSEPQKWDPQTRETADHSLPYLLAAALADGRISLETFTDARIRDPALRPLMQRIHISDNDELTSQYPAAMPGRVELVTRGGQRFAAEGRYPRGHPQNPMTDEEIEGKFKSLCEGVIEGRQSQAILDAVWNLEAVADVAALVDPMCSAA